MASKVFLHYNLVGDVYICYLLARQRRMQITTVYNLKTKHLEVMPMSLGIVAKDAIALPVNIEE